MADIGLQTEVKKYFDFLVTDNNFTCSKSTPYVVTYESPSVFITIAFDGNRSYELDLMIGLKDTGVSVPMSYSIAHILRYNDAPEAKQFSLIQVTNETSMAKFVQQLSDMIQKYGKELIAGDTKCFDRLAKYQRARSKEDAISFMLNSARSDAEKAWREKDYAKVFSCLKPFTYRLTSSELAKLQYSEKQLGN